MSPPSAELLAKNGVFAARLRELMRQCGLTVGGLAVKLGATGSNPAATVSPWLHSRGRPGPRYRDLLPKVLGVSARELYDDGPAKKQKEAGQKEAGQKEAGQKEAGQKEAGRELVPVTSFVESALVTVPTKRSPGGVVTRVFDVTTDDGRALVLLKVEVPTEALGELVQGLARLGLVGQRR